MKNLIFILLGIFTLNSCQEEKLSQFNFLVGTWQVEGKANFEKWEASAEGSYEAHTYKLMEGIEVVLERISLTEKNGKIYYTALVPDQNNGANIDFILNESEETCYSFENLNHDFPNKIQYKVLSQTQIEISVLDKNNQGFTYIMNKI